MQESKKNNEIPFSEKDVPIKYQWSGYANGVEEFKDYNFLTVNDYFERVYICSSENGVALGDYLSNYIFKKLYIFELESVLSPGYDYWFFQAWEKAQPYYDDLDDWIKDIVEMLISKGYITKVEKDNVYFLFSDLSAFEKQQIPEEISKETESICKARLLQHFDKVLNDYGDLKEVTFGEGGKWAQVVFDEFAQAHPEYACEEDEEGEQS